MLIGVPKEIKNFEYRVGLVPSSVRELIANGHQVIVEKERVKKLVLMMIIMNMWERDCKYCRRSFSTSGHDYQSQRTASIRMPNVA